MSTYAQHDIDRGNECPYDAPDGWRSGKDQPLPPVDWAHKAARGIMSDLNDRCGIKDAFSDLSSGTRHGIVQDLAEIIRTAAPEGLGG